MKTSAVLALSGSLLAMASPINKRVYETEYVTDLIYVTVTVDPWTTTTIYPEHHKTAKAKAKHTTLSTAVAVTTTTPVVPPPKTNPSSSTIAPVPTTSSTSSPEPVPTTSTTTPVAEVVTIYAAEVTTSASSTSTSSSTSSTFTPSTSTLSTSAAAATSTASDFATTAVYHHNIHRANHSAPDASWNSDLADYAATVAASCVFAHDLTPGASTGSYGQNIAMYGSSGDIESTSTSTVIAQAITDMWYNGEVWQFPEADYGLSTPDMTNFESWGHFSQVVWVASTEVGCAVQYCAPGTMLDSMGAYFSVCNYRSPGNVGGSYATNVLKSLGEASVTV